MFETRTSTVWHWRLKASARKRGIRAVITTGAITAKFKSRVLALMTTVVAGESYRSGILIVAERCFGILNVRPGGGRPRAGFRQRRQFREQRYDVGSISNRESSNRASDERAAVTRARPDSSGGDARALDSADLGANPGSPGPPPCRRRRGSCVADPEFSSVARELRGSRRLSSRSATRDRPRRRRTGRSVHQLRAQLNPARERPP